MSGDDPTITVPSVAVRKAGPQWIGAHNFRSYINQQENKMTLFFKASNQQFLRVNQITHDLNFAFQALNFTQQVF